MGQSAHQVRQFRIDNAGGVGQYVCVVQGANDFSCKIPTAANAPGFLGVTYDSQLNQNMGVPVVMDGIIRVKAHGVITRGDRVGIGSNTGDVASVEALITAAPGAASVQNVIGMALQSAVAGDVISMRIAPCVVNIAVS